MAFLQEYTMLDELGKGGFATVYKVRHNELGYIRAVRVLNETIVDSSSKTYQKFLRECKLLLRLGNGNHPNIVHIYQPRLLDNKALVEMDFVDGNDISHYLKHEQRFVPFEEVIRMATQMSSALAYCHEGIYKSCMDRDLDNLQDDPNDGSKVLMDAQTRKRLINKYKVIHNDIHSGNIMRKEDGNYVLLDFGLAINGDEVVRSSRHANGAPEFKSPEKWDDESILSEQSDIYSFGVVLYEMLAGWVPFPMNTKLPNYKAENQVAESHKNMPVPPLFPLRKKAYEAKNPGSDYVQDYPDWMEALIMKCLSKKLADRFANGSELQKAILNGIAQTQNQQLDTLKHSITVAENEKKLMQQRSQQQDEDLKLAQKKIQQQDLDLKNAQNTIQQQALDLKKAQEKIQQQEKDLKDVHNKPKNQPAANEFKPLTIGDEKKTEIPSTKWKTSSAILALLLLASMVFAGYLWLSKDKSMKGSDSASLQTIDSLQQVNKQLLSDIDELREENQNQQQINQNLVNNGVSEENQLYSLTEQLTKLQAEQNQLTKDYNDLKKEYQKTKKQRDDYSRQLYDRL